MTNGEMIQKMFPNLGVTIITDYIVGIEENYEFINYYPLNWWNAEYTSDFIDVLIKR